MTVITHEPNSEPPSPPADNAMILLSNQVTQLSEAIAAIREMLAAMTTQMESLSESASKNSEMLATLTAEVEAIAEEAEEPQEELEVEVEMEVDEIPVIDPPNPTPSESPIELKNWFEKIML